MPPFIGLKGSARSPIPYSTFRIIARRVASAPCHHSAAYSSFSLSLPTPTSGASPFPVCLAPTRGCAMGFNFRAGHPEDAVGDAGAVVALVTARFGPHVPLGTPGDLFVLPDEIAWSWWSELQAFSASSLGEAKSTQIRATDAWYAVYLDVDVERDVLRSGADGVDPPLAVADAPPTGFLSRLARALGLAKNRTDPQAAAHAAMQQMVERYGARAGESNGLQVGNLRKLIEELDALVRVVGAEPTPAAVESLRESYAPDDRADADGHVQCLCHAWLTAKHALETRSPLWLVK